jgi:hypothetical protein
LNLLRLHFVIVCMNQECPLHRPFTLPLIVIVSSPRWKPAFIIRKKPLLCPIFRPNSLSVYTTQRVPFTHSLYRTYPWYCNISHPKEGQCFVFNIQNFARDVSTSFNWEVVSLGMWITQVSLQMSVSLDNVKLNILTRSLLDNIANYVAILSSMSDIRLATVLETLSDISRVYRCTNNKSNRNLFPTCENMRDRLCCLVVRVPGYRSRGPRFDSRLYQIFWKVVGLEWGPLSHVSITEELFEWKSSDSGSRKPKSTAVGIRCADYATSSIRKSWH